MAKFEDIFGNFVMVSLMILALFSVIIIIQNDNNAPQPLVEDELFNSTYGSLNETIGSLEGSSSTQYNIFSKDSPKPGFGAIVMFTIVNVGKTFGNLIFVMFTLIIKLPLIVLGIDQTIVSMIISFLTITVVIALWIVYKFVG